MIDLRVPVALVAALLLLGACKSRQGTTGEAPYPAYIVADAGDAEMEAAMAHARETVGDFIAALKAPSPAQSHFAVKARFDDGVHIEHMWVEPVRFDGKVFTGPLNDEPFLLKSPRRDEPVRVDVAKISDWSYAEGRKLVGGFTLRVMRARLSPQERLQLDQESPFELD